MQQLLAKTAAKPSSMTETIRAATITTTTTTTTTTTPATTTATTTTATQGRNDKRTKRDVDFLVGGDDSSEDILGSDDVDAISKPDIPSRSESSITHRCCVLSHKIYNIPEIVIHPPPESIEDEITCVAIEELDQPPPDQKIEQNDHQSPSGLNESDERKSKREKPRQHNLTLTMPTPNQIAESSRGSGEPLISANTYAVNVLEEMSQDLMRSFPNLLDGPIRDLLAPIQERDEVPGYELFVRVVGPVFRVGGVLTNVWQKVRDGSKFIGYLGREVFFRKK